MKPGLYLIPTTLGNFDTADRVFPAFNYQLIFGIKHFIVEQVKTSRRFLRSIKHPVAIDDMTFYELNKHTNPEDITSYLEAVKRGEAVGLISEAGTPCVADPGSVIVEMAHEKSIEVFPLVGPNSILLALMGSGFNGQNFTFNGYLPIDISMRNKKIQYLESLTLKFNQTQIFIETPYRNNKLFDALLKICKPSTKLCLATDVSLDSQSIKSKTIKAWKKEKVDLNKKPTVFLISK